MLKAERLASVKSISSRNAVLFPLFASAFEIAVNATAPDQQLNAITAALHIAEQEKVTDKASVKHLHLLAADIHVKRWHVQYAIASLQKAQQISFDSESDLHLKKLKSHLQLLEKERNLHSDYIATQGSGPAKSLQGKVLVAYVFIDDGIRTRWSEKTMMQTGQVLNQVENWQSTQALRYGISDIHFENEVFLVQRNPYLKHLDFPGITSSREVISNYVDVIAKHLGAQDIGEFITQQMQKANVQQGVLILHSNFQQRSFARRCGFTHQKTSIVDGKRKVEKISHCTQEFAMLMEPIEHNRWDKLQYSQAHEMLHLFGADDLYNIRGASNYAVTDIMNFQSRYLSDSEIAPISAYAIGWQVTAPKAPFKIIQQ